MIRLEKSLDRAAIKRIRRLYLGAFPSDERAPFRLILSRALRKKAELWAAYDEPGGAFVGMAYMVTHADVVYLFYLAVEDGMRGKGYGAGIISRLREIYAGKRMFLARERLDEPCDNLEQRQSRRRFYITNGFRDIPCRIKEGKVTYDVMTTSGVITAAEYEALITGWGGRLLRRMADMHLIEE